MVWFKVDDGLVDHPKVLAAGNAAMGLWVRSGAWSMKHLTDGMIPRSVAMLLGDRRQAKSLVDAGLWVEVPDGYRFHDWEVQQRSRATVLSDRDAANERKRRSRESRRDATVTHAGSHSTPVQSSPDQTRDLDESNDPSKSAKPIDPVDNSGLFDLEKFRHERPDLDRLSDTTVRQLATETLAKAKRAVKNETGYVLRAAKDPVWVQEGDKREWDALIANRAVTA